MRLQTFIQLNQFRNILVAMWILVCLQTLQAQCVITEDDKILPPPSDSNFGKTIAIDGDTAIVGASIPDDEPLVDNAESAHIFQVDVSGNWVHVAKLTTTATGQIFANSVAIHEDVAVVGAAGGVFNGNTYAGSAYIFVAPGTGWQDMTEHTVELAPIERGSRVNVGHSVAINSDRVVVGAPFHNGQCQFDSLEDAITALGCTTTDEGKMYIFNTPDSVLGWGDPDVVDTYDTADYELSPFDNFDEGTFYARFGTSVAMSGDILIVGAPLKGTIGEVPGPGSAFVFEFDAGTNEWVEVRELRGSTSASFGKFGDTVAIDSDTAVVGMGGFDPSGTNRAAFVFEQSFSSQEEWVETGRLTSSDTMTEGFGFSVAIFEETIIVGDPYASKAFVYSRNQGQPRWLHQMTLLPSDSLGESLFSDAIGVSGDGALIGARRDDEAGMDAGAVYAYPPLSGTTDCNYNGVSDYCDIASGKSLDLDGNGVPDECQNDCNLNGEYDIIDIVNGEDEDCELPPNGTPDKCDCRADVGFCDRIVNVDDIFVLIGDWGDCPPGIPCRSDVWPLIPGQGFGDGKVNQFDLSVVIDEANWGCCPGYDCGSGDHQRMPSWVSDCLSLCDFENLECADCIDDTDLECLQTCLQDHW